MQLYLYKERNRIQEKMFNLCEMFRLASSSVNIFICIDIHDI